MVLTGLGGLLGPEPNNIQIRVLSAHKRQFELAFTGRQTEITAPGSILVVGPSTEARPIG